MMRGCSSHRRENRQSTCFAHQRSDTFFLALCVFLSGLVPSVSTAEFRLVDTWEFSQAEKMLLVPVSLAIDTTGSIYLPDPSSQCAKKFDRKGRLLQKFGEFKGPSGIALDAKGQIYVADSYNDRIVKSSPQGRVIKSWGSRGSGESQFIMPAGIAIDPSNNVWVCDKGNFCIKKFTSEGIFLMKIGAKGGGNGQFEVPISIAADTKGSVYVADGSERIQKFNSAGEFLASLPLPDKGLSVAIGKKNNIFVGCFDCYVHEFTEDGRSPGKFRCLGPLPSRTGGTLYESLPDALAINPAGEMVVLDLQYFRVLIFAETHGSSQEKVGLHKIAYSATIGANMDIYVVNSDGSGRLRITTHPANDKSPAWSPDAREIAFTSNRDGRISDDIYLMNCDGSNVRRLTQDMDVSFFSPPAWSPEGKQLAFSGSQNAWSGIYVIGADGTGLRKMPQTEGGREPDWSPEGGRIAFSSSGLLGSDIYVMNTDGTNLTRLTEDGHSKSPKWSPDGNRIVFNRGIFSEVWVMNSDGSDPRQVTSKIGANPDWSPDGSKIVFSSLDGTGLDLYTLELQSAKEERLTYDKTAGRPSFSPRAY